MRPKPKEILELEKIYNIELSQIEEGDIMDYENRNKYELDNAGKIIGLNLSDNLITRIENLDKLVNLTSLNLGWNQITRIENLDNLVKLTFLNLGENQITRIENLDTLVKLNKLDLMSNQITKIENLDTLSQLTTLNLSKNHISKIENINNCQKLKKLFLNNNLISQIENLDNLKNLSSLYLSANKIIKIKNLDNLKKLKQLKLGANLISKIENLNNLKSLITLNLGQNRIIEIENLFQLPNLMYLDLWDNQIERIENLYKLPKISALNLKKNKLVNIELNVDQLQILIKRLSFLNLYENPIINEMDLLIKENENHLSIIKNYLDSYDKDNIVFLPVKIMMLGNHYSGKSTFTEYFISHTKALPQQKKPTHILEIKKHDINTQNHNLPDSIIYDFGGHDYYHGIYQAFLTNDSINCIFWQKNTDYNMLAKVKTSNIETDQMTYYFDRKYWLHQLKYAYGIEGSNKSSESQPIFMIQTRADQDNLLPTYEDYDQLHIESEFFLALIDLKPTENAEHSKLQSALDFFEKSLLSKIEYKRKSQGRKQWYIDFLNYIYSFDLSEGILIKDLKKEKIPEYVDENEFMTLLDQLCKQGLILYYIKNKKLNDIAWLNPQKTVEYIHSILNKEALKNRGIINKDKFVQHINDQAIIDLLIENKVIFLDTTIEPNYYIIPGYLETFSKSRGDNFTFSKFYTPNLIMKFEKFIPFGMINRLICYYGRNPDEKTFRRDYLAFTLNSSFEVSIRLEFENLEIKITVRAIDNKEDIKPIERRILDDIIALYWDEGPKDYQGKVSEPIKGEIREDDGKWRKSHMGIIEEAKKRKPISDLFISVDGNNYINLQLLDDESIDLDEMIFYPIEKNSVIIKDQENGQEIEKDLIYRLLNKSKPRSGNLLAYRHLSTNKKLNFMKKVFISYSKHDKDYLKEFDENLKNLKDESKIEVYFDELTDPGEKVHEVIEEKLRNCDYLFALVSRHSLNTTYITDIEINMAEELGKKIIPIIIKPCDWEYSKLGKYYSTLKGHPLSLNKDLFLNDQIKETTAIERQAWWVEIIKELRSKLFNNKI